MLVRASAELSVVIVNYRSEGHLAVCLRTIDAQTTAAETIVVDNGSDVEGRARVLTEFPAARWLPMGRNIGFSAAANRGAVAATTQRLLFLNPDCKVRGLSLHRLVQVLDSEEFRFSIVGCAVFDEDGAVQLSCRRFPSWRAVAANRLSLLTRVRPGNSWSVSYLMRDFDHQSSRHVDWVSGAAVAMRASVFRVLGGFDERFFLYFEDVDLCHRARDLGIATWYCPDIQVQHLIGGSSSSVPFRSLLHRYNSMWTYYKRYHRRVLLDPFVCGIIVANFLAKGILQLAQTAARGLRPQATGA